MSVFLGIQLTLLIGPGVPVPVPSFVTEAITNVQVTHSDEGRSGFQIGFEIGRSGLADIVDYKLLSLPIFKPFNRLIAIVTFNATPTVLVDGFITNHQLSPGTVAGSSTLTITGEDVSIMMDLEEKNAEHIAMPDMAIVQALLLQYQGLLLSPPIVIPPTSSLPPNPREETPAQKATDLGYIQELAERYGYVFYVKPGAFPGQNLAYWGPPERISVPQRALTVNLDAASNVDSISFEHNALAPNTVSGIYHDSYLDIDLPVETFVSTRPPLALMPDLLMNQPNVRKVLLGETNNMSYVEAYDKAQNMTDVSTDEVVTANGELDALRYGGLLNPRGIVGLRGVGFHYDGLYYVKSVTHNIQPGEYKQSFTLTREGRGTTIPAVLP